MSHNTSTTHTEEVSSSPEVILPAAESRAARNQRRQEQRHGSHRTPLGTVPTNTPVPNTPGRPKKSAAANTPSTVSKELRVNNDNKETRRYHNYQRQLPAQEHPLSASPVSVMPLTVSDERHELTQQQQGLLNHHFRLSSVMFQRSMHSYLQQLHGEQCNGNVDKLKSAEYYKERVHAYLTW